jgi:hypothetical protein
MSLRLSSVGAHRLMQYMHEPPPMGQCQIMSIERGGAVSISGGMRLSNSGSIGSVESTEDVEDSDACEKSES